MKSSLVSFLGIALLLVSCNKEHGANAGSNDDAQPGSTRANRASRQDLPGRQRDLRQSLADAKKLTAPAERDKAIVEVARAAMEINHGMVAEAIRQLSADHPERALLIKEMVVRLMEEDPNAATAWVATLESPKDRALGGAEIALRVSTTDPARAARLLAESGISGSGFDAVAAQVLDNWTIQTPTDAAAWVLRFPAGTSRDSAVKTVVTRWVQSDPGAAFSWMSQLNNPAVRKETSRTMAAVLVGNPAPVRASMLEQADPALRTDLEQQIGQISEEAGETPQPQPAPTPEPLPEPIPEPAAAPEPAPAADPEVAGEPAAPEPEPAMEEDAPDDATEEPE